MAATNAVWGIDVGQCSLKAIKLRLAGEDQVEAVAFDLIEHPKILSQPDAEPDELIKGALEKFTSRNDWQGDQFVIGVPGQQTFARFCKMPPVDQKKIPDLVRFEASQQIPFDMDDVVWDYQAFTAEDSPDLEVGIFAIRKDLVRKHIEYFANAGIAPTIVQTLPSALYNFCRYDRPPGAEGTAAVIINVGAQNTDLVIVEPSSAWSRNIPLGGNSFTEALVRAFKLSFAKAESLKRTAATSKYARQIFQAMRPVFADLVAEIQRSIGFFSSTHRDVELKTVLALGNAFRLPGLQKYLENNLTVGGGVVKLEKFSKMVPSATINAPNFTENILTFGAAYGLALQGLGLATIRASLLPRDLARVAVWKKKRPFFIATAACLAVASILPWTRNLLDQQALASTQSSDDNRVTQIIREAEKYKNEFAKVQTNTTEKDQRIQNLIKLHEGKRMVPQILALVHEALPESHPALQDIRTAAELKAKVESGELPRPQRRQLLIESLRVEFVEDIDEFELPAAGRGVDQGGARPGRGQGMPGVTIGGMGGGRGPRGGAGTVQIPVAGTMGQPGGAKAGGFHVRVTGRLLYGESPGQAVSFLTEEYYGNLRNLASRPGLGFHVPDDPEDQNDQSKQIFTRPVPRRLGTGAQRSNPMSGAINPGTNQNVPLDPVTGEDMSSDWNIDFGFKVKLGEKPQTEQPGQPGAQPPENIQP
ncbi:MAG: type IV pilus assembly protein PilM [Planctomycetota bacterium]